MKGILKSIRMNKILRDKNNKSYIICQQCGQKMYGGYHVANNKILCIECMRLKNGKKTNS